MTTVLLHTGQTAPILEPRQPEVRVVRGGKHGLNRARQFAAVALYVIAAALLLGLAVCAAAGALLLRGLADVLDMLEDLAAAGGLPPELLAPLVKTLGIALVSRLGTEICRDAGQGAMAAVLEAAGAFGAVLVSLPLVRAAWELLRSLI